MMWRTEGAVTKEELYSMGLAVINEYLVVVVVLVEVRGRGRGVVVGVHRFRYAGYR